MDNNTLELLSEHYQIGYKNKDQLIRDLVNNYHEQEIFEVLLNYDVNLKNNKTIVRADEGKERFLAEKQGLKNNSVILAEQIRTIDKSRLKEKIGHIDDKIVMSKINNALGVSFGLEE